MPSFESVLADGTTVLFRPIRPDDKQRLADGFARMSPESRYRRFFQHIDHLSPAQLRYLTEVDGVDHFAWVAVLRDEPGRPGVGVGRWVRQRDDPAAAEGAVTVVDDYHNLGIGKTLLVLAARSAVERGIRTIRAWVQADNAAVIHVLEELGARTGRIQDGLREVAIPLPAETAELHPAPGLLLRAVAAGRMDARAPAEAPAATAIHEAGGP